MKPDQTFKLFQFLLSHKAKKLDNKSKLLLVTLHAASNIFRHSNNFSIFDFKLGQITGMSRTTIYHARKQLIQQRLILVSHSLYKGRPINNYILQPIPKMSLIEFKSKFTRKVAKAILSFKKIKASRAGYCFLNKLFFGEFANLTITELSFIIQLIIDCNRYGWINPIPINRKEFTKTMKFSRSSFFAIKKKLSTKGYLKFTHTQGKSMVELTSKVIGGIDLPKRLVAQKSNIKTHKKNYIKNNTKIYSSSDNNWIEKVRNIAKCTDYWDQATFIGIIHMVKRRINTITYPISYALKVFKQWHRLGVTSEIAAQNKMAELKRKFDNTACSYCEQLLSQD